MITKTNRTNVQEPNLIKVFLFKGMCRKGRLTSLLMIKGGGVLDTFPHYCFSNLSELSSISDMALLKSLLSPSVYPDQGIKLVSSSSRRQPFAIVALDRGRRASQQIRSFSYRKFGI